MTAHTAQLDSMLREMVKAIVDEVDPEQVILFGSRARGDSRSDSDVDLLVVEREPGSRGQDRWKETARLRRALWRFPVPIDLLVYSTDEVERWKTTTNHVVARSLPEGKVLYDRS